MTGVRVHRDGGRREVAADIHHTFFLCVFFFGGVCSADLVLLRACACVMYVYWVSCLVIIYRTIFSVGSVME